MSPELSPELQDRLEELDKELEVCQAAAPVFDALGRRISLESCFAGCVQAYSKPMPMLVPMLVPG